MSIVKQVICTFIVCLLMMNMGLMYAWPSSTIQLFSSKDTILNRPMSDAEQALFGSLYSVIALISTPLTGISLDALGRKKSCIIFALPQVVAWIVICVSEKVEVILFAVCVSGMSSALFSIIPMYISEISQETVRGTLTAAANIFWGVGVLLSYALGCLEYRYMNYANLTVSVVGAVLMLYVRESPVYLMATGRDTEAADTIAFYRGVAVDSKEVDQEVTVLRRALNPQFDDLSPEEQKLKPIDMEKPQKLSLLQFLGKSRSSRRALYLVCSLTLCSVFQGVVVVQVYAQPMFEEAMPSVSGNVTGILFASTCIVVGVVAASCLDLYGRRALIIYPSLAGAVSCLALGAQIQYQWGPGWLTGVFIFTYCIAYSLGAGTVPYVVIAEVFLPEVRSILTMVTMEWAWICNFLVLFIFNPLVGLVGLGGVFYMFAAFCLLTAVLSHFYLPETKALPVDVIQMLLVDKKRY